MKKPSFLATLLRSAFAAGAMLAACELALASEDVDIFGGKPGTGALPNILIVLDSSSNWNSTLGDNDCAKVEGGNMNADTKFAAEVCALVRLIPELPAGMRLGIMMFTESGNNGAYVRFAAREMTDQNKKAMVEMLKGWVANGSGTDNSGSNQPMAKAMFEAFKYFGGAGTTIAPQGPTGFGPATFAGGKNNDSGSYRRDYAGNKFGDTPAKSTDNRAADYYGADGSNALSGPASNEYIPPNSESCTKNFIVFVGNGNPSVGGDNSTNPATAVDLLKNIGGNPSDRILSAGVEEHASLMDEMARHLYKKIDLLPGAEGQQKIITYTLAVYQPQKPADNTKTPPVPEVVSNTDQQLIKLMQSSAINGGGQYFAARNAKDIIDALRKILNDVQAVNSVFVSASLPVSVNTQGTFLNQVYMGLFRPEPNPRWMGNVKQYKFVQDSATGDLYLADAKGERAVNTATGFTSPAALSFWTQDSTFWSNDERGIPPSKSDAPDGDVVEKGGTAYVQRRELLEKQTGRKLYTCIGCANETALAAPGNEFNNTNITSLSDFDAASAAELELLVDWIRGEDNAIGAKLSPFDIGKRPCNNAADATCTWKTAEAGPGWPTTVRPSLQGDVLHSRPVVLNYDPDVGGHAVKGPYMFYGSNDGFLRAVKGGQDNSDGKEVWAFVAPEFFSKYRRLRFNDPPWLNPGTDPLLVPLAKTKDYFFDGPIGAWEDTSVKPHKKWIFVTARRGGRVIYAFDVTNPEQPILKWKKSSIELDKLGQTWSLPVAFKLTDVDDPYLVFGAGYDPGEDAVPAASTGVGRGIYVLNAHTGAELAFLTHGSMSAPIASDMAFLAKPAVSGVGDVYRGYVGDLAGNVWRLDVNGTDATKWAVYQFAKLGDTLKFMYAPDVVRAGDRDVVLVGSGDREKPLATDSKDYFFGLSDFKNALTPQDSDPGPIAFGELTEISGEGVIPDGCATCKGWFRAMTVGEKVVNSPLTVAGVTFFATNKPVETPPGNCQTNLGEAKAYGVAFLTGGKPASRESVATVLTGGGLPPSPVGGVVELEPGKLVTFVIGSGKDGSRLEPERPPLNVPTTRTKIYWNTKTDMK